MVASIALAVSLVTAACAADRGEPAPPPVSVSRSLPTATWIVSPQPELAERIHAAGYEGAVVILDPASERMIVSDVDFAERRFIPASTFKIPNSLIALETGVADSPAFALEWDGVEHRRFSWNRDHDMRSAFEVSAVWYYQAIARRIGERRMAEWVRAADYGNADISGGIDQFWLTGGLRISAREQVEFLRRIHVGESPFSAATIAAFFDEVMIDEHRIRAKLGWASAEDGQQTADGFEGHVGWYVGSVAQPDGGRVYFATLLLASDPAPVSFSIDRGKLTRALLAELGYWAPPD